MSSMVTQTADTEPVLLRATKAPSMLGVSRALAYRWTLDGTLPALRVGRTASLIASYRLSLTGDQDGQTRRK